MAKKALLVVVSTLATVMLAINPITAITDGELDGNRHPYVGLMVAQAANGTPLWRCSGTLLSATLFLTAGHCTESPAAHVEIWFDADVECGIPGNGYPFKATWAAHHTRTPTTTRAPSTCSTWAWSF